MIMFVLYRCHLLIFFFKGIQDWKHCILASYCDGMMWKTLVSSTPTLLAHELQFHFPSILSQSPSSCWKMTKKQEWCAFYDLTVITWTNEPNQVSASSLLEDINFPLQGVVVVTCWDAPPPSPRHKMGSRPCDNWCSISSKSHYICFVPPLPPTYTTAPCRDVVGKEKHNMCSKKFSERAKKRKKVKMKH